MKLHYQHYKLQLRIVVIQYPILVVFSPIGTIPPLWFCSRTELCFNFLGHVPASPRINAFIIVAHTT